MGFILINLLLISMLFLITNANLFSFIPKRTFRTMLSKTGLKGIKILEHEYSKIKEKCTLIDTPVVYYQPDYKFYSYDVNIMEKIDPNTVTYISKETIDKIKSEHIKIPSVHVNKTTIVGNNDYPLCHCDPMLLNEPNFQHCDQKIKECFYTVNYIFPRTYQGLRMIPDMDEIYICNNYYMLFNKTDPVIESIKTIKQKTYGIDIDH